MALRFAANLTTMFTHMPLEERFEAALRAGFSLAELQFPYEIPAFRLKQLAEAAGVEIVLFNLPPGDLAAGERGIAALGGREDEFAQGLGIALEYAATLGTGKLHCMAGIPKDGISREEAWETYRRNVKLAARRGWEQGIHILIEPINSISIPGYLLDTYEDAVRLIEEIESEGLPAPGLQFDIFHCAMMGLDVPQTLARVQRHVLHYQIAGVPGRNEPDRGELDTGSALAAVLRADANAIIGCEYTPLEAPSVHAPWMSLR